MHDPNIIPLAMLLIFVGAAIIYFIPFWIALLRGHPNKGLIFLVNIFVGFTGFGYIFCIFWACMPLERDYNPLTDPNYVQARIKGEVD